MFKQISFIVAALLSGAGTAQAQIGLPVSGTVPTTAATPADPVAPKPVTPGMMSLPVQRPADNASSGNANANAMLPAPGPQAIDYANNTNSDVFGANLFTGAFAREGATRFNPDYALAIGDQIQVRLWGAFEFDAPLTVDPKGNIFIPHAGPVQVLGVRNADLQHLVETAVARVYRTNVFSYASLAAAQPVRVFVSGFVNRPGLYGGTSMDSLLHFLDAAGGIDPERGSFLSVQVKRGQQVRAEVNLYDFLVNGLMPQVQLADGDVIFVNHTRNVVRVTGLVDNAKRFEFSDSSRTVADLAALAKPKSLVTHVRIMRNTGAVKNVEYVPLSTAAGVNLQNGDEIEFTADRRAGTITVRVEGEHQSAQEYVLPYGAHVGDVLPKIEFSSRSDIDSVQLFRASVKVQQKLMLQTSLKSLEAAALTARSGTSDEAVLRKNEADLLLQWVERAKTIEFSGQVVMGTGANRDALLLEDGDIIRIPVRDGLVLVSGDVLFPNAIVFDKSISLDQYIARAGGYTQNADQSRVILAHADGSFADARAESSIFNIGSGLKVKAGDKILVLPKIDVKNRQFLKDITQIVYQIAVSAAVVLKF
jgi:protein involved in polysaccharide export with SLBB domain